MISTLDLRFVTETVEDVERPLEQIRESIRTQNGDSFYSRLLLGNALCVLIEDTLVELTSEQKLVAYFILRDMCASDGPLSSPFALTFLNVFGDSSPRPIWERNFVAYLLGDLPAEVRLRNCCVTQSLVFFFFFN
jgi:hypothetical protein